MNTVSALRSRVLFTGTALFALVMSASSLFADDQPPLIVSQDHAWPPFSYLDSRGEPQGLLIDLWQAIGAELERPVQFQLTDWGDGIDLVRRGEADVHGGLFASSERSEFLIYSEPVLPLSAFVFVDTQAGITSMEALANEVVGVVRGSFELENLRDNHPALAYREFANNEIMIQAAVNGEMSAFMADYPVAMYLLDRHATPSDFHPLTLMYTQQLLAAATPDNQPLVEDINLALARMDPEIQRRINQRWLRSEPVEVMPRWLLPLLSFAAVILAVGYIGLLVWQRRRLRRQVAERTRELEQSEAMFRTLAEGAAVGIYIVKETRFQYLNSAMGQLLGYAPEELVGERYDRFIHLEDASGVLERTYARTQGHEVSRKNSFRVIHRSGEVRTVEISADLILIGNEPCVAGTVIDVTDHIRSLSTLAYEGQLSRLVADISSEFINVNLTTLDASIDRMLSMIGQFFHADRAYLMRFDADITTMTNTHEWCAPGVHSVIDELQQVVIDDLPWWREQLNQTIHFGEILTIDDVNQLPEQADAEHLLLSDQSVGSLLCIPVTAQERTVGFIGFDSLHPRQWPESQARQLRELVNLLSDALTRAEQEQTLTTDSITDPLTGLFNRRHLELTLNQLLRQFREVGTPFSVAILDLDHFKVLNDTWGHQAGDEILGQFSRLLERCLRVEDLVARYGGEEFVVVFSGCELTNARRLTERILAQTRELTFTSLRAEHKLTVSAGVASVSELEETEQSSAAVIELADQRLYRAKAEGRDRLM